MKKRLLYGLILLSAGIAIAADYWEYKQLFAITKGSTTLLIIYLGWSGTRTRYEILVYFALAACLLGDLLLLEESRFVFGLGAFLIAHLLFTLAFIQISGFKTALRPLLSLLLIAVPYYWWLWPSLGDLAIPVGIYVSVIVLMCWQGLSVALERPHQVFRWLGLAVLLFLFSDAIIALNKFKYPFALSGLVILSTYWLSISIIADSAHKIGQDKTATQT